MLEPFTEEVIRLYLRFQSQHALSISVIPNTQKGLYTIEVVSSKPRRYRVSVPSCLIDQVANKLL